LHTIKEGVVTLEEERNAFNKKMKAKAILMAIEWAGSAPKLAMMIGYTRYAGYKWLERVDIPMLAARALEKLPGFPVKASDLLPDVDKNAFVKRKLCPHCWREIRQPGKPRGCSLSFNRAAKSPRKQAAAKRKKAIAKTKKQAAKLTTPAA
jgi:Putative antitoxin of bacterial toxin-antitoxin system, YdaS/YdaT